MITNTNKLIFEPANKRPDLLCSSIRKLLTQNNDDIALNEILVAEIDPEFAGGKELCIHYNIPFEKGANCVVIEGMRGQAKQIAACLYPVGARINMNTVVRKQLNARRISLALVDEVLEKTGMEYGSITPLGLPDDWPVLIDSSILLQEKVIIGSGKLHGKLCLSPDLLTRLTNASIIEGLVKKL